MDDPAAPPQHNWHWCDNCHALAWGDLNSACPAGGRHQLGATDYVVFSAAPVLSILTANTTGSFDLEAPGHATIQWQEKVDRFANLIIESATLPDIISMTETHGWTWCSSPLWQNTGDYDLIDRLIWKLQQSAAVTYRVAYMVGQEDWVGGGRCRFYGGDAVLYNPHRVSNLTAIAEAALPQVAHDDQSIGFHLRRSLPLCNRGTSHVPLQNLIDGPPQLDKCQRPTPSGPVWMLKQALISGGSYPVASMVRFSLVGVAGSSFDAFTIHYPNSGEASGPHRSAIEDFITTLTASPRRIHRPYYPCLIVGDYNALRDDWPRGPDYEFWPDGDVMVVGVGRKFGLPAEHDLYLLDAFTLPDTEPLRPPGARSFSDHCALVTSFAHSNL